MEPNRLLGACRKRKADGLGKQLSYEELVAQVKRLERQIARLKGIPVPSEKGEAGHCVSERESAEQALRESEERFRGLFEEAPIAIQGYYPDGTIHYWNKANYRTYGYTPEEAIGKNLLDLIIPEEMRAEVAKVIRHGAETGEMPPFSELTLRRKDGSRVPVLSSHVVVRSKYKEPELYCLDNDLTEQKRLQAELQQAHKMEAIGTLTGGISHDFNNILGIITGNCELALEVESEQNPAYHYLTEILKAALRGQDIVRQLLTFCRKTEHRPRPMCLIPIIEEAVRLIRAAIPAHVDIRHELAATDDKILSEPTFIYQVLMNLCSNAAQAMETTGGLIDIRLQNVTVEEGGREYPPALTPARYVQLMVADTGPGIDPSLIDRVFDPYYTTKAVGKGTGLGLAVVQGIVKSHRGAVSVISELGKGTTFIVYLPLSEGVASAETEEPIQLEFGDETILLVDDEKSIVEMAGVMLGRLGYSVETFTSPLAALERFLQVPLHFDLVITDLSMPQMTGLELIESLRVANPEVPVILCTGFGAQLTPEKMKSARLDGYLTKPIIRLELAGTVRKALDKPRSNHP
jgi:PAS domain S-box-containing protein